MYSQQLSKTNAKIRELSIYIITMKGWLKNVSKSILFLASLLRRLVSRWPSSAINSSQKGRAGEWLKIIIKFYLCIYILQYKLFSKWNGCYGLSGHSEWCLKKVGYKDALA